MIIKNKKDESQELLVAVDAWLDLCPIHVDCFASVGITDLLPSTWRMIAAKGKLLRATRKSTGRKISCAMETSKSHKFRTAKRLSNARTFLAGQAQETLS